MVVTWDQLTFLTPAQQAAAAKFADIGKQSMAHNAGGPLPDISTVTQSQAKTAEMLLRTLVDLVGPANIGIQYVRQVNEAKALADYQAANPGTPPPP